jgi:hypothetical protein
MRDDDEVPEPVAAALAEAADAVGEARRALTVEVVGAHRAGIPLSRIARYSGLHPIALGHLLAAAGEPFTPAWPEPGGRPKAADRDGIPGIPTRTPEQPARGTGARHTARAAAAPRGGTVMFVLLGCPGRLGGLVMLYRSP